jgi:hypothetical protein
VQRKPNGELKDEDRRAHDRTDDRTDDWTHDRGDEPNPPRQTPL